MFSRVSLHCARGVRAMSTANKPDGYKVAVLGASGGIGQPLSMFFKFDDRVSELSLFDLHNAPGVAADLSHIRPGKIAGFNGSDNLGAALKGCDIVVIPAGVPRKPGMTRDDLFNINAGIVRDLAVGIANNCPDAAVLVIANPVNSTVPIVAETLKKHGVYNPKKVFGVTTLDVVRANTFVSENQNMAHENVNVPVIGGHAGTTILPLLSQVEGAKFDEETIKALTHRIQFGGDEVVKAKDGAGSATLSMAYAGWRFTNRLIKAFDGEQVLECTYTENNITEAAFFSTPTILGPEGVMEHQSFGKLSAFEQETFDSMLPDLKKQIQKGIEFANK